MMELKIEWKVSISPFDTVDKLAMALNAIQNNDNDRKYFGVFSKPYNKYTLKNPAEQEQPIVSYCDELIDGKPYSWAWRWWGKRAEAAYEELKKLSVSLTDDEAVKAHIEWEDRDNWGAG
jgi:hypothetical protein